MNYEANTRCWKAGDIVIHDADAKEPRMLMEVVGYSRATGLCITVYQREKAAARPRRYENELRYLHDPARFALFATGEDSNRAYGYAAFRQGADA